MGRRFTKEQEVWLVRNFDKYKTYKETTSAFNVYFNENRKLRAIAQVCHRLNTHNKFEYYTSEQDEWLKNNIYSYSTIELTEKFNQVFSQERNKRSIINRCFKLGIKFTSNKERWLENLKKAHSKEIGHETISNGYVSVKVRNNLKGSENYKGKHVLIYEQHYGDVPKGKCVCFLNGDKNDFDIENLYCVDRGTLAIMTKYKWFNKNKDITLTAIKWCELYFALKQSQN